MEWIMNATVGQIVGAVAAVIAVISVLVEGSKKIKKFPISAMLQWIGERTNKTLTVRIDALEKKVDEIANDFDSLEQQVSEHDAINCRVRILQFSDEIRRNIQHSQESFEQVISDIDFYEKYCDANPGFKNNKTIVAKKRILDVYEARLEQNDFL